MKNILKYVSISALVLFGLLIAEYKFYNNLSFNNGDLRNLFVLIYLFTNLKYYQYVVKEKDELIENLNDQLANNNQ
ncbi:MAG: hypothetical protein BM564_03475 [Bacteroidetes bacterium MedPE-SWsnd-G2]|nr:MAG: hypothetical protein BM564_03475 [Bacteroidetes bacterium MedPE-SWsnd-G2]